MSVPFLLLATIHWPKEEKRQTIHWQKEQKGETIHWPKEEKEQKIHWPKEEFCKTNKLSWIFYSASALDKQTANRNIAPIGHIFLI
jgi:hypothetical protein